MKQTDHTSALACTMSRRLIVVFLSVLLLWMQQEAQRHAFEHVGHRLKNSQEQTWQAQASDDVCALCALFAGGAAAAPGPTLSTSNLLADTDCPRCAVANRNIAPPTFYRSRAPPALS